MWQVSQAWYQARIILALGSKSVKITKNLRSVLSTRQVPEQQGGYTAKLKKR